MSEEELVIQIVLRGADVARLLEMADVRGATASELYADLVMGAAHRGELGRPYDEFEPSPVNVYNWRRLADRVTVPCTCAVPEGRHD